MLRSFPSILSIRKKKVPDPHLLTVEQVAVWRPYPIPVASDLPLDNNRERMRRNGQWAPWQMIGRRMAIGCVALEVTQRCNLDCSYCYLSESSEALKDIPLEEVFRRIDLIHAHYGPGTDVQVTGGDPTLRDRDELIATVAAIKRKGMRSSLFTNGIKASRELLADLSAAGLEDVAFHVDMTQARAGFDSEAALNRVREEYVARARGLPLAVIFNTTVFPGNFHEVPALARFFIAHADVVRFASFQIGADTGRGTERARVTVNSETVKEAIRQGAGAPLNFDAAIAGHADCNGYAYGLIINGKMHDFFNEPLFVQEILATSAHLRMDRARRLSIWKTVANYLLTHPRIFVGIVARAFRLARQEWRALFRARGRVGKLSFFVHNFMDASTLNHARCDACSFMVMSAEGPISMCVHNAKRDHYLLQPSRIERENKLLYFNPVTGVLEDRMPGKIVVALNRKTARGRAKDVAQHDKSDLARAAE